MVHTNPEFETSSLILDFEFDQHLGSHKHVINIIMWFRDMGCYIHRAGFINDQQPNHVCLLSKSLYGLKHAPHTWFQHFGAHLQHAGIRATRSDSSLFVYKHGADVAHLLLDVNDIILMSSTLEFHHHVVDGVKGTFAMKDLGHLH
jgi:hypothetical protein